MGTLLPASGSNVPESRVMVLTGAASGIGRHLAGLLARAGHRLVVTDLDEARLVEAAGADGWPEERVLRRKQDVRAAAAWPGVIDLAFRTWGRLDVMLNVAGFLRPSIACLGTVEDVGRAIVGRVLLKRPLEITLPRHRGWIARAAGLWPRLGMRIAPFFIKRGAERQKTLRGEA